jgi:hypothetical protein
MPVPVKKYLAVIERGRNGKIIMDYMRSIDQSKTLDDFLQNRNKKSISQKDLKMILALDAIIPNPSKCRSRKYVAEIQEYSNGWMLLLSMKLLEQNCLNDIGGQRHRTSKKKKQKKGGETKKKKQRKGGKTRKNR